MPDDSISEFIAFEALNVASGDFDICPACDIGILFSVDSDVSKVIEI